MRQMRARRKNNDVDKNKQNRAFSDGVFARDGRKCRMEIWKAGRWVEHGIAGSSMNPLDPSHIYKRNDCGEALWDKPVMGLASCRDCHERYEGKLRDGVAVRVPLKREAAAWKALQMTPPNFTVVRKLPAKRPGEAA